VGRGARPTLAPGRMVVTWPLASGTMETGVAELAVIGSVRQGSGSSDISSPTGSESYICPGRKAKHPSGHILHHHRFT
jgi:hypothetical protein